MTPRTYPTVHGSTAARTLATVLVLWAATSSCSSPSGPSAEPVVYNLVSIFGRPLPAPMFKTGGVDENGEPLVTELIVNFHTITLLPDGTFLGHAKYERRRNGITIETLELGPERFGTFRWVGDTLVTRADNREAVPEGGALIGNPGPEFEHYPVSGTRETIWTAVGTWVWIYQRAGGAVINEQ